jgi:hypothetical protein
VLVLGGLGFGLGRVDGGLGFRVQVGRQESSAVTLWLVGCKLSAFDEGESVS